MKILQLLVLMSFLGMCMAGEELVLNVRGVNCEKFEFAELNSMSVEELDKLYCSLKAGDKISEFTIDKQTAKFPEGDSMRVHLAKQRIIEQRKCTAQQNQIEDIIKRKEQEHKFECSKYKGFDKLGG